MTDPAPPRNRRLLRPLLAIAGGMVVLGIACASRFVCFRTLPDGLWLQTCPAGDVVKQAALNGWGLRRGETGHVEIRAVARYTFGPADHAMWDEIRAKRPRLELRTADGRTLPLEPKDGWERIYDTLHAEVVLPDDLPDGDHRIVGTVVAGGETLDLDAKLPLYAPARVHVLTDRPLYEPGNTLQMRAVTLRAADLTPLGGRPGRWQVHDAEGTLVFERELQADEWGVASGRFPLSVDAASGDWRVSWVSGEDVGEATVRVEPFTLPRFRVEADADRPWYRAGDRPVVTGRVVYASGAPVAGATIAVEWSFSGAWPPPTEWSDGGLPAEAMTDADGRYVLRWPAIPADLVETVRVSARVTATDAAGEQVAGSASLLLSEDALAVDTVTEMGAGLVQGFNNRVYLRATTPDGQPLPGATLIVKRAHDPADPGIEAVADEDGVASLQLDPGPPVSVELPVVPLRPAPPPPAVTRTSALYVGGGNSAVDLADARRLDEMEPGLTPCGALVPSDGDVVAVTARIDDRGRVEDILASEDDAGRCVAGAVAAVGFLPGRRRTLKASWRLSAPDQPRLVLSFAGEPLVDARIRAALEAASRRARRCLPDATPSGDAGFTFEWRTWNERGAVVRTYGAELAGVLRPASIACVARELEAAAAGLVPTTTALGVGTVQVQAAPARQPPARAQARVVDGYALTVEALAGDEVIGETTLRLMPGAIPDLRLRADPVLATAGETVTVTVLRGPDFVGDLPKTLRLARPGEDGIEAELDATTRAARFPLPADAEGWYAVQLGVGRALVWVAPKDHLSIALSSDAAAYAPGSTATLRLQTSRGGTGLPASVGLFGVDQSLAQLTTLPGPDALDALRPAVSTPKPAFDTLDALALTRGQVRGRNAAEAVLLRVGMLPDPAEMDRTVSIETELAFDPTPALVDAFSSVLTELHAQVRAWEAGAPDDEQMTPETMARLWTRARTACADRGEPASDAFGRPLRLHLLPPDLLALTEPRVVVIDGTRLPEDVENWAAWVAEEQP